MKTLNKLMAATIAAVSVGNAIALPDVSVINTRVGNILDKIGVDGAGFDAGDYTISGSNDLGDFSSNFTAASGATAQDIADQINAFNVVNTTVYVPASVASVNGVRSDGLEDLLLNALSFKIDEITGDVGSLVSSFADGKLAFETVLNNGDAIIAPSSVDYSHADAQTWFGVKNSLDIFTAASEAWVVGIRELNGDMDADGTRDTGRVSHFDANVVVGAEVAVYAADQDVTTDVTLVRSIFADDGTETLVTVDLGTSYDRDALTTASVALGSTKADERNGILSGETIFSTARHFVDASGYGADILNSLDATALTTVTVVTAGTPALETNKTSGWYYSDNGDGTWSLFNDSDVQQSTTKTDSQMAQLLIDTTYTGKIIIMESSSSVYDGVVIKYNTSTSSWMTLNGANTYTNFDADGNYTGADGGVITGGSAVMTEYSVFASTAGIEAVTDTTINSTALDALIKNSEIKGYAEELLLGTVDLSSPTWLQNL